MRLKEFSDFTRSAQSKGIFFYYSGFFSQSIIAAIADTLRHKLECQELKATTARKVFSSFIEMAQNVLHYSDERSTEQGMPHCSFRYGSVAVGTDKDKYFIVCGNRVKIHVAEQLRDRLDPVCKMTCEEIKQAYKKQLRSETEETSMGAGLGFLTVARDATEPIQYTLDDLGDEGGYTYFYVKAMI